MGTRVPAGTSPRGVIVTVRPVRPDQMTPKRVVGTCRIRQRLVIGSATVVGLET